MPHSLGALFTKLSAYTEVDLEEVRTFARSSGRPRVMPARQELRFENDDGRRAFLIEEGWAYTYKVLPNGSRQVIDIGIGGDILGMRGLMLRRSDMLGALVTPGVLVEVTTAMLQATFRSSPRLAAALLWAGSRDEAMVVEHLVDVGRRSAIERISHFMLELRERLKLVGLCDDGSFRCPLSQSLIADALGLTPIHLNRTLRELREAGLMDCSQGVVHIFDELKLAAIAGYSCGYLDQPSLAG